MSNGDERKVEWRVDVERESGKGMCVVMERRFNGMRGKMRRKCNVMECAYAMEYVSSRKSTDVIGMM